jgi:hypothetical protein
MQVLLTNSLSELGTKTIKVGLKENGKKNRLLLMQEFY